MSDPVSVLVRLLVLLMLVALNGFFVATEFALVSVRRTRIAELADEGVPGAADVHRVLGDLDRYIAATQLGITMASLGLGWLGAPALDQLLQGALRWLPAILHTPILSGAIAFVLLTALHNVFGELAPKSVALQRPERTALRVVGPISLFLSLFRPAIALLSWSGNGVVRLLGLAPVAGVERAGLHSAEEIELLVEQSARGGALDDLERRMLRGVFDVEITPPGRR